MKKLVLIALAACLAVPALGAAAKQKAEFIIVESGEYVLGQEDPGLTAGISGFLGMEPEVRKITQLQASQDPTMANLDYSFLPLYLIKKTDAVREKMKDALQQGYVQETNEYIVLPNQTNTGIYTNKEAKPNVMELYVMSQCPYGVMAENKIIEAKRNGTFPLDKVVKVRYIVNYDANNNTFSSLHGAGEWEEDVRQLLIAKYYPTKLWQYLSIRNKDYQSSRWDKAMKAAGINVNKINKKMDTEGLELLKQEAANTAAYGISASPSFVWEGKQKVDFNAAAQIPGFAFMNPNVSSGVGAAPVPAGSC